MVLTQTPTDSGRETVPPKSRQRIVDTARRLFLENGYLGVSMQQIADAAGLRKASLYHHFRSKEALFAEVMAQEMDRLLLDFSAIDLTHGAFADQLGEIARIHYRRFDHPEVHQLAMDFFKHVPESDHEEVHKRLKEMQTMLSEFFAQAMERGEIRTFEPHAAASMFFHMLMSLGQDQFDHFGIEPPPPDVAAGMVVDVLLNGLAR